MSSSNPDTALAPDRQSKSEQESSTLWERFFGVSRWTRLLDAAFVIAVLTGSLYYFGWRYYYGFYSDFGIPPQSLELATPLLAIAAIDSFLPSMVFLLYIANFVAKSPHLMGEEPTTFKRALWQNLILVLLMAWYFGDLGVFSVDPIFGVLWKYFGFFGFLVVLAVILSMLRISIPYNFLTAPLPVKLIVFWAFVTALGLLSEKNGRNDARALILGDEPRTIATLHMKDSESWFNGRPMILIAERDDRYYLTPFSTDESRERLSYSIPIDEIRSAVFYRD